MVGSKVLYVQTSGPEAPDRAYAPFLLAIEASAAGKNAIIYFFLKGVTIMKREELERIRLKGYPDLGKIVDQAVRSGVKLEVCGESCRNFGVAKQDLIDHVKIVGAPTLNDRILEADGILSM